ncbi:HNH endonuclease [Hyphococcus sp.]|jgi:hypothetical protein|uniref:HNH endonuclease n=1 Tax=Hyphococcus sp. TaxID=2038636 RepID=UPI003D0D897A
MKEAIDLVSFYQFNVRQVVCFYSGDYFIRRSILDLPGHEQLEVIRTIFEIGADLEKTGFEILDYIEGSTFHDFGEYEVVKTAYLEQKAIADATKKAKANSISKRRSEFARVRNELVLSLLHRGDAYVCYHDDCSVHVDLTIDHIVPLSHGGTDELNNLRFACRRHNSQRGAGRID